MIRTAYWNGVARFTSMTKVTLRSQTQPWELTSKAVGHARRGAAYPLGAAAGFRRTHGLDNRRGIEAILFVLELRSDLPFSSPLLSDA